MTCTACLRALRHPQPQALHAEALSGWEKRIMQDHWSRDERMGGRHAASQAHSTNVMCTVPAGTPTASYAWGEARPTQRACHPGGG
jgi:hypothetical protein